MLPPRSIVTTLATMAGLTAAIALPQLVATTAAAQRCDAPQVLLTVDKSSSMLGVLPGGSTKWDAATNAIGAVTSAYDDRIDFGLQPFPYPNRCEPGRIELGVGPNRSADVLAALGSPPPDAGNWTPMAQTLDEILTYTPMLDVTRDNHVIVVTDGWQWCSPYDPDTRFTPVVAVERLRAAGITVHVVGFGASVDALTLNRAAVAAGTALPGCDATGTDPAAPNHCYMQADDRATLEAALDDIAREITAELCDGLDNDCDGLIDEGYDVDGDGVRTCDGDCADDDAGTYPGAEDICDGLDNDCDGSVDTGCDCTDGDTRPCGSDTGTCQAGTQTCTDGAFGTCEGEVLPEQLDRCTGFDDDCDGEVDEDADCGEFMGCHLGYCVDLGMPPMTPDPEPVPEDVPVTRTPFTEEGGCACTTATPVSAPSPLGALGALAVLGMATLRSRRRRR